MNVVASPALRLRKLTVADNPAIAHVIRQVSAEYGLTADKGYTVADPNLDELYQVYSQPGHAYWVVEYEGEVVGGGGIAPLTGKGLAKKLALMAMEQAREMGFKRCYLETTAFLKEAIALYEHLGFEHIDYALGCTGHVDCEVRMLRKL